jgi:hypothetical protein
MVERNHKAGKNPPSIVVPTEEEEEEEDEAEAEEAVLWLKPMLIILYVSTDI